MKSNVKVEDVEYGDFKWQSGLTGLPKRGIKTIEIGVFMPSWTPWKWRCKVDKRPLLCENEENSLDNSH